ncbi:hypothetical protein F2P79_005067 [Pimephales promelas]|nr:hypothetical protein F2P79_005067 [Pimephales promelas]
MPGWEGPEAASHSSHGTSQTLQSGPGLCCYFRPFWLYVPVFGAVCAIGNEGERFWGPSCLHWGCLGTDVTWWLGHVV